MSECMRAIALAALAWCLAATAAVGGGPKKTSAGTDKSASDRQSAMRQELLGKVRTVEEMNHLRAENGDARWRPYPVTLAPAQWIWLPSGRTLPNTFVLFRREVNMAAKPVRAIAWLTADSRYRLTVNGRRVQWGPAPCDPRQLDVDPVDLAPFLTLGKNVIGVEVLHYGIGDGTWPAGKPGMIFHGTIEMEGGKTERVVSDASWLAMLDRAHRPGGAKRWFLRGLQEEFDARLHPFGWDTPEFVPDARWLPAMPIPCPADKPASASGYPGGDSIDSVRADRASLRARQIPALKEIEVAAMRPVEAGRVEWLRDPADWFEFRMPGTHRITREPLGWLKSEPHPGRGIPGNPASISPSPRDAWRLPQTGERQGVFVTFEFQEQIVGWPYFTIDAPAGTIVELITQESHDPSLKGPAWLDTHIFSWTRFVCREGINRFETFDYESLRWLQLHIRNASRPVTVYGVGVRRRMYPWTDRPEIQCRETGLQRLFDASVNTLYNCAQETCVDGMGRERQQYSGDGGHQLLAVRCLGEPRLSTRFLRTFSEGLTADGYFLDCWPAFDRLARVMQKEVDGAYWGPLLDHGIGFNFDCWQHYQETGDLESLVDPYPRLVRFAGYLATLRGKDGLLPVEDLGIPTVWMDHEAYKKQRHKQCAFNLYAAAMLKHALSPIARAFGETDRADHFARLGDEVFAATVRRYWSAHRGVFVNNLPWLAEEKEPRLCDRSLATAVLFDQCPGGNTVAAIKSLAECPPEMGLSYPCNANWRYWALAKAGRTDIVLADFRKRWATMGSVRLNNTIQEDWQASPDSTSQWSHCTVTPIYVLFNQIAGIRPASPGFARVEIRPQLADLAGIDLVYRTVCGPIRFRSQQVGTDHEVVITLPPGCKGELLASKNSHNSLERLTPDNPLGLVRYQLKPGQTNRAVVRP